jgi:hypothetical protein
MRCFSQQAVGGVLQPVQDTAVLLECTRRRTTSCAVALGVARRRRPKSLISMAVSARTPSIRSATSVLSSSANGVRSSRSRRSRVKTFDLPRCENSNLGRLRRYIRNYLPDKNSSSSAKPQLQSDWELGLQQLGRSINRPSCVNQSPRSRERRESFITKRSLPPVTLPLVRAPLPF